MVGNSLLTKWRSDVMSAGERETAFACERVEQFSAVSELSDLGGGDLSLLQCSVAAESEQVRQCCASALAKHGDVAKLFGFAEDLTTQEAVELFPSLVLQAFRPLSLSAADQTVASSLKMDSEEKRRWVLSLGCSLMARGQQRDVLRGFVPIIEGTTCNLSTQSRVAFSKTEAWVQLCPEVDGLPVDQPVEQQLCQLFTSSTVATAVQKAHNLVMAATRAMALEASANTIDDGGKASAAAAKSKNPFAAENVRIIDFEPARTQVNPYSADGRCFKVEMDANSRLDRLRAGDNVFRVVPSYDCDSKWGPNYTAADAWRDRRETLRSAVKDGGVGAGDASKVERKSGANAVRAAREIMAKKRNESR
ncbi:MAG: hypothetical protein R3E66_19745 [bacterium]